MGGPKSVYPDPGLARLIVQFGVGGVFHHRRDAVVAGGFALIHFGRADHLTVRRLQVEHRLAVLRLFLLEAGLGSGILTHRFNAVHGAGFFLVAFAREDHLAVAGFQTEPRFAALIGIDFKLASHVHSL